ncbi:MAG: hypothetical protein V3T83_16570 [Acidobacteriota bacterium]
MNPQEDWQRKADFLLEQQAQFHTQLLRIEEQHGHTATQLTQLTDLVFKLGTFVAAQSEEFEKRHRAFEERQEAVEESHRKLEESQRRTDERLNVLINVVERYFSNGGR